SRLDFPGITGSENLLTGFRQVIEEPFSASKFARGDPRSAHPLLGTPFFTSGLIFRLTTPGLASSTTVLLFVRTTNASSEPANSGHTRQLDASVHFPFAHRPPISSQNRSLPGPAQWRPSQSPPCWRHCPIGSLPMPMPGSFALPTGVSACR